MFLKLTNDIQNLPLIALRGIVAFPDASVTFEAARPETLKALETAMAKDKTLFMTAQIDADSEELKLDNLYKIGTVATIAQAMRLPNGTMRIIATGKKRAVLTSYAEGEYITCGVCEVEPETEEDNDTKALERHLKKYYEEYFSINKKLTADSLMNIMNMKNPDKLCNVISHEIPFPYETKQASLELLNVKKRMEFLTIALLNEIELAEIQKSIDVKVKSQIDKNQREYYLREQMKVIEDELGDSDGTNAETAEYLKLIASKKLSKETREKLEKEVERLRKVNVNSSEGGVIRTYLDTVLALPWNKRSKENMDIDNAKEILDEDHFGLEKVKERILEYLSVRAFSKKASPILCLVGPPGVGKTSIASSIARALGKKYVRVSLGGIHDEADIRGHRKTYIGAMPGRIMSAMTQAGTKNPLMLLDEIDKVGSDYRGDPYAALLEVLDAEQNFAFRDHYTEVPFDLSEVMFVTTANTLDTISRPLLDRMEVIEISGYTPEEKLNIAKEYLVPKTIAKTGLSGKKIEFADDAICEIIDYYTKESGVRSLEREIFSVCRKIAKLFLTENRRSVKVTKKLVGEMLGKRRYSFEMMNKKDEVGIARGLAWTQVGGDTLSIEVNIMDGTGKTELTGHLGDVMKESALAAISFIRSKSKELKIEEFHKNKDIHIHVPEGAVPKDGPSAGITMATAVISALTGRPVRRDVAMTGEITLRGRVLPIGGLKEKSLAAYRAGITTVIIPDDNKKDLEEIPESVKEKIEFIPVSKMEQVIKIALI